METPVADFVRRYADAGTFRFHMPGHKGRPFLGCERLDITEISGADALYESAGILRESEANAAALFASGRTLYSTEGSSQCIRAMVYLAVTNYLAVTDRPAGVKSPAVIVAGRNAHKAFVYAAALSDAEIVWLWPETRNSVCACPLSPETLRKTLDSLPYPPAAVYLTSPDYLGGQTDITAFSALCREYGVALLVDNAHGAYLRFLDPPAHPLDLGADLCCDSAHKTLPVLTGGAYLHIHANAPARFREHAKAAMALFGSTSPSYLTLASLDLCNRYLSGDYPARLRETVRHLDSVRADLRARGWRVENSDPLRLTLRGDGEEITRRLREGGIEWEYADREFVVLMATPENTPEERERIVSALGENDRPPLPPLPLPLGRGETVMTPREVFFSSGERIPAARSLGRICGIPVVSCPPAVPIVMPGERIGEEAVRLFARYSIREVEVVRDVA